MCVCIHVCVQRIVCRDASGGEVVLMEGGPQIMPTSTTSSVGGGRGGGGGGGGEGGRSGRKTAGKSSLTSQASSATGIKNPVVPLNPLAVVTPSGKSECKVYFIPSQILDLLDPHRFSLVSIATLSALSDNNPTSSVCAYL